MKRSFGFHVSNYAAAEVLATVAGLLSFPILTRLLSVSDYGTMNLVASALGLTIAAGKLGLQHAALRSYSEISSGKSAYTMPQFESTVFWGMALSGSIVTVLWAMAVAFIPAAWWGGDGVGPIMLLAAPLILIRVLDSALVNQLRALEDSKALAIYSTARRYATLALVVGVLIYVQRGLIGFYAATIAIELVAAMALLVWMHRGRPYPSPRNLSKPLYLSLAIFGLPMLGTEISNVILTMSDRYIIQVKLDAASLGVYAASYNMCDYIRAALLGAMVSAAYPTCMRLWEFDGREALTRFISSFMHYYISMALLVILVVSSVGSELMSFLASSKYRAGGEVIPLIMIGMVFQSLLMIAGVGLYIAKKTTVIMWLVLVGGIASIAANYFLVPRFGIRGAGMSLVAVFLLLTVVYYYFSREIVHFRFPMRSLIVFVPIAGVAYLAAVSVHLESDFATLVVRTFVGGGLYCIGVLAVDRTIRGKAVDLLQRVRANRVR
jgi:O-antigen/teichoic acid export membrane protein